MGVVRERRLTMDGHRLSSVVAARKGCDNALDAANHEFLWQGAGTVHRVQIRG